MTLLFHLYFCVTLWIVSIKIYKTNDFLVACSSMQLNRGLDHIGGGWPPIVYIVTECIIVLKTSQVFLLVEVE